MPQEEEVQMPLRFYGLVFYRTSSRRLPETKPLTLFTFDEDDLAKTGWDIDEVDLEKTGLVPLDVGDDDDEEDLEKTGSDDEEEMVSDDEEEMASNDSAEDYLVLLHNQRKGPDPLHIAELGRADFIQEETGVDKHPEGGLYRPRFPPVCPALAFCPATRSLILVGGALFLKKKLKRKDSGGILPVPSDALWSVDATATPPTWKFCRKMCGPREGSALVVPYVDRKIYIFGGNGGITRPASLEIYDPRTGELSAPVPLNKDFGRTSIGYSYFLWKDSSAPHKKQPLIMMHFSQLEGMSMLQQLWSYDVEDRLLTLLDPNFPAFGLMRVRSVLLPLGRHDTLLIVAGPGFWWSYDLCAKKVKGRVVLNEEALGRYSSVRHGFCRYSSDSSALVYLFMDRYDNLMSSPQDVTCVKFRLEIDREKIVAYRVREAVLRIGENFGVHMFAAPETDDLGGQGRKRKHGEGCS